MIMAKLTALVTVAAILYIFFLTGRVGALRGKTGVAAPATTGDPIFERAFRVHMNSLEQLVVFLPVLWLSVSVIGDAWSGLIGTVWLAGRIVYASAYMKDPAKRSAGMLITMAATMTLAVVSLIGIGRAFLAT
ncbi:MAPEG family protein [Emcibacter sp. SYSU 3D8]|uniref:MAPEG family protein n=1 Tax=Emcibacter sp. SYSU 3D8 TaxID=3133969 RepID=UPI0031FF0335